VTTTDPHLYDQDAMTAPRRAIREMILGLQRLTDWLNDHPLCAESRPTNFGSLGVRQLVYCMTDDEFAARFADLSDGADNPALTQLNDNSNHLTVRRSFGGGVFAEVFTDRRDVLDVAS